MVDLKQQLHALCLDYVEQRIIAATQAIQSAQASANEETKSSAGDKYETGRAMAQLEIEKNAAQLVEAQKLKQVLSGINPNKKTEVSHLGSIVITNHGNFYIAVAASQFTIAGDIYHVISPSSPLAQKLLGLTVADRFAFNKKEFFIIQVL